MTCMSPQRIADRDLLAYLDGEAGSEIEQHLAGCADCRERSLALANLDRNLSARLHRIGCPPPEELGEYHLQLLADDRAHEIRRHVAPGNTCCLLGSSGVGKTTLINRLIGNEAFATQATSRTGEVTHRT